MWGGSASNGKIENGKYYLGEHGTYTEVSEEWFDISLWHTHMTKAGFGITMIYTLIYYANEKRLCKNENKDH